MAFILCHFTLLRTVLRYFENSFTQMALLRQQPVVACSGNKQIKKLRRVADDLDGFL